MGQLAGNTFHEQMDGFKAKLHAKATKAYQDIGVRVLAGRAASVTKEVNLAGQMIGFTHGDGAGIVGQSTVLTGNLVSNWVIGSVGSLVTYSEGIEASDATESVARVASIVGKSKITDEWQLGNATPYIYDVEYNIPSKWNWQQRGGWIRSEVHKFQSVVAEVVGGLPD